MADKHPFLSPEWVTAAKALQADAPKPASPPQPVKMNLVITGAPFSDEDIKAYMDSTSGEAELDLGEVDSPQLTLTVDYDTAKAAFVDQDQAAAMQAFMAGKVKVVGDMTKLMTMMQGNTDPAAKELADKIKEITA